VGGEEAVTVVKSLCSNAELVMRQSLASKDMNTDTEEAFTRQLAKIQQNEKT
jgi:hypothetical protein